MAIKRVDPINGNDANDGSTWALARKSLFLVGDAAGDVVRIKKTPDPAALGVNATFTDGSATITLGSALTDNIDTCETAWTAANGNVTTSTNNGTLREGTYSTQMNIAAGFTTGKIAYKALGASYDYSVRTRLSFWIYANAAVAANTFRIDLCSDTTGDVPVNSFTLDRALFSSRWNCFAFDNGGSLGSSIQSISITALIDPGTVNINLDNILACNEFTLESVIGKNDGFWWPIRSINGTSVTIGNNRRATGIATHMYCGVGETVPAYHRYNHIPLQTTQYTQSNGTSGNLMTYSGGWDSTTDTQNGETWFNGYESEIDALNTNGKSYIRFEKLGFQRFSRGIYCSGGAYPEIGNISFADCGYNSVLDIYSATKATLFGEIRFVACYSSNSGMTLRGYQTEFIQSSADIFIYQGYASSAAGFSIDGRFLSTGNIDVRRCYNGSRGIGTGSRIKYFKSVANAYAFNREGAVDSVIETLDSASSSSYTVYLNNAGGGIRVLNNTGETPTRWVYKADPYSFVSFEKYNGAAGRFKRFHAYGDISDQQTGGQASSWWSNLGGAGNPLYLNPSSTNPDQFLPVVFFIPCTSGVGVQVSGQAVKTAGNPTLTYSAYGCGITEIVDESVSLSTSLQTFTSSMMTPTETGFIRVELRCNDGSTTGDVAIGHVRSI